ncbi:MAG: dihydrodipicolinate reductase, partial [Desulfobacterales bacterium]|nr:dihydrodipicolinate reductase [Desulfobacterales bacterium]
METIKVMVNGLPGNVARILAGHIHKDKRFNLIPYSLTGAEILESEYMLD